MTTFIDTHRGEYGVEPVCRELAIAPSTYYERKARERDGSRLPARARRDAELGEEVRRVGKSTSGCTGSARCGVSFAARASRWPGARSHG